MPTGTEQFLTAALEAAKLHFPYTEWGTAIQAELDTAIVLGVSPTKKQLLALYDGVGLAIYAKVQEVTL